MANWVYLMIDERTRFVKIGRSNAPRFREKTLQAEMPLVEIYEAWAAHPKEETRLHRHFASKRLRGEWFRLNDADIESVAEHFKDRKRFIRKGTLTTEREVEAARIKQCELDALNEICDEAAVLFPEDLGFNANALDFAVEGFGDFF